MLFCKLDCSEPGPRHKFRFIYDGNVSNFLVIAHPLDGSRPFTSSVCRLEEIMPGGSGMGDARDPAAYVIGQKSAVSQHAFQATFDISNLVSPLRTVTQRAHLKLTQFISLESQRMFKTPQTQTDFSEYVFLISVFRGRPSPVRLSTIDYILLDNYVVASEDYLNLDSMKLDKKANIVRVPVIDESLLEWNETTWPSSIVPPLIKDLDKIIRDEHTPINLPARSTTNRKNPQHVEDMLLARLSLNEKLRTHKVAIEGDRQRMETDADILDNIIELPPARHITAAASNLPAAMVAAGDGFVPCPLQAEVTSGDDGTPASAMGTSPAYENMLMPTTIPMAYHENDEAAYPTSCAPEYGALASGEESKAHTAATDDTLAYAAPPITASLAETTVPEPPLDIAVMADDEASGMDDLIGVMDRNKDAIWNSAAAINLPPRKRYSGKSDR